MISHSSNSSLAVVDVGSNTIKVLVTRPDIFPEALFTRTLEVRIGQGLGADQPRLTEDSITLGSLAVEELVRIAREMGADPIEIVATSAVRDAANGDVFSEAVTARTGLFIRVLSGEEEATSIIAAIRCDPDLSDSGSFSAFDLGGGSMEVIAVSPAGGQRAQSLPLGAVRLAERFFKDPSKPLAAKAIKALRQHIRETIMAAGLTAAEMPNPFIASGGAFTIARKVIDGAEDMSELPVEILEDLFDRLAVLPIERRLEVCPKLPASRADIFPIALLVYIETARTLGGTHFRGTRFNLRFGRAAQLLAAR
jgi:exopolyphosphatase/guanosine-5'-triphosphate,3'-diphosphate pyrophosphatase